jgi:4-hydroxy-4-methyl-2-oxoglutarate aldolase
VSETLSPALIDELRRLDSCAVANAIETFDVRLRNEGFTDARIRCVFPEMPPVIGYAVTATIRCSTPPPVGHTYSDRTDWWNDILKTPAPRVVVVQDVDSTPGLGAFVGEVHANILRALKCVAYVTNGAVRDLPAVGESGLQLFAAGTSPSHAFVHILSFGEPVTIAGLTIAPGDLLFGDRHGVVAIPPAVAAAVPSTVAEMRQKERRTIEYCRGSDFSIERLRSIVNDWD